MTRLKHLRQLRAMQRAAYLERLRDRLARSDLDQAWEQRGQMLVHHLMVQEEKRRIQDAYLMAELGVRW